MRIGRWVAPGARIGDSGPCLKGLDGLREPVRHWNESCWRNSDVYESCCDDDEKDVQEFWRSISMAQWKVKEDRRWWGPAISATQ